MLYGEGNDRTIQLMKHLLQYFCDGSGQLINLQKIKKSSSRQIHLSEEHMLF